MKNKFKIIITLSVLGVVFSLSSCNVSKVSEPKLGNNLLPKAYDNDNEKDSMNIKLPKWADFYKDPDLISLIDSALYDNFDVLIATENIKKSQALAKQAHGALLPNLNFVAGAGINRFGQYTMDGAGNAGTPIYKDKNIPKNLPDYLVGLQTSWEIDVFGKLKNQKKSAIARLLGSVEYKNVVITNLVAEIANNYYELLALDLSIDILDKNIKIQEDALELIRIMKQAAKSNELAVKQFEAQVNNIKVIKYYQLQQITETENRLNILVGRYPQHIRRNKNYLKNSPDKLILGIPTDLLSNRPDVKMAEYELLASKADLAAAKASFYPSLSISGTVGYQAFLPSLLFSPKSIIFGLLGNLTAPLLNRASIKASFQNANASQNEALFNYQKTILNSYVEVYNEMKRINNLENIYLLKDDEVKKLTAAIDISNDLFKYGRANYLEVLVVQQNVLQANLDLISAKKEQFQSVVNIYKALGGGWIQ
ncbi:TolC family protein [Chryseobacterium sp.]|uniref:TolC family protein n=1 Tax=Chryseobacterium sp. TaxID=1871047 RepID=UPI0025C15FC5|nr:TolC family protein [Chryseobacterium sp.]